MAVAAHNGHAHLGVVVGRVSPRPFHRVLEQSVRVCPRCGANGIIERLESRALGGIIAEFSCGYGCGILLYWGTTTCEACQKPHRRIRDAFRCWQKQRSDL